MRTRGELPRRGGRMNNLAPPIRAKPLGRLLAGFAEVPADAPLIRGLNSDSREVQRDELFVALRGRQHDGRDHIAQAVRRGATAIVFEPTAAERAAKNPRAAAAIPAVPSFPVADLRQRLGAIAARFFEHPSRHMRIIGVTGTNGKTTCAYLLAQAMRALGGRCGFMGTLGHGFADALQPAALTTVDAIAMQRVLAGLRADHATAVCMEASSHGLAQGRVNGVEFNVAVLTNLSRDHLDYHGNMRQYARAKQELFIRDGLDAAVLNMDDAFGRRLFTKHNAARGLGYGLTRGELRARNLKLSRDGIVFDAVYRGRVVTIRAATVGEMNAPNLLAVIGVLLCCEYDLHDIAAAISECKPPPGRMEFLPGAAPGTAPTVAVDYAHTPHALQSALTALRPICAGKIWAVFGCGGERDMPKRARMGRIAEQLADHIILTDDNPRGETPAEITAQIAAGMRAPPAAVIHDRRCAIHTAIRAAAPEDFVLIAGKGHETVQDNGDRIVPMNDREIAAAELARYTRRPRSPAAREA